MIKITIEGDDAQQVRADVLTLAGMMGGAVDDSPAAVEQRAERAETKPTRARSAGKGATPAAATQGASPPADETDRELLEPVPPAPTAATQVVDAGTGQPVPAAQQVVDAEPVKQMTVEDVQKAAAQLVQKDIEKLKDLLNKYGAPNVKAVKPEKLGEFAADVLAALG